MRVPGSSRSRMAPLGGFVRSSKGVFTTLHIFSGPDGEQPIAGLTQATDANLYGTTIGGGDHSGGTIFTISQTGKLQTLYSSCAQSNCADGDSPWGGLLQATSGTLYGTTYGGGNSSCGCGTVFSLKIGFSPFVAFVQEAGRIGRTAEILGQGFTGTTGVAFNGVAANFAVKSDSFLTATVPAGATTGYVTVATPSGKLKSNVPFHVIR
jgi:uncharacterized repeat protein (TIGR03803 family)